MIESVLIFSRATPHHHTGGMETVAWSLAAEWAKSVGAVEIVTTAVPGVRGPFVEEGVNVVPLNDTPAGRYSHSWWSGSRRYWDSRATAPSVVLSVSAAAYSVVRGRSRHPRTPFVLQSHGTSAMEIGSKLRARSLRSVATAPKNVIGLVRDLGRYRDFDRIVAVGERVVESLAAKPQSWVVNPDSVHLIRNGVQVGDHAFDARSREKIRSALGVDDRTTVVGCVGRLHVQKRLDRALRAAAALRDRERAGQFRFLFVGDGPDEGRLRGLAREHRLEDMVLFVGRVDRNEVRDYYAAADLALLTTARREVGLPMAVLEALACGLPSVVPTSFEGPAALEDVIRAVDPSDPDALADALCRVRRPAPRVNLLPPGFSLEQCAREYLTVFGQLVSARTYRG